MLTGDPKAERSFEIAAKETRERFAALETVTRVHGVARRPLEQAAPLLEQVLAAAQAAVAARRQTAGNATPKCTLMSLGTEPKMTQIRGLFQDFFAREWQLLADRSERSHHSTTMVKTAIFIGTLFGVVCVAASSMLVQRDLQRRERAKPLCVRPNANWKTVSKSALAN